MSRRKKEKGEHEFNETWLLPYSDLMTLLLALFIVLFASSAVDAQKFQSMSKVFSEIFTGGTGIVDYESIEQKNGEELADETKEKLEKEKEQTQVPVDEQTTLSATQERVNQYILEKGLTGQLKTSLTSEGLLVTINDSVLFDSGSAEVREEDIAVAKEISDLLVIDPPHNVIISGHTDNVPIQNSNFSSNWELSVMRAVNFMKIILENDQLDPRMFSAKGFGEFQPIASNDTEEGKAKNRRVEVLILPNGKTEQN
ncbi:flagellar motor protein MotB [Caldibacillus sp. 210928-DFI.2.22]|uniref:flagellar motor protein MotB n=1 Tax=Caldibacillus TaxID=1276290 RepID=UPI001D079C26|nr:MULTISPECIES: flagellar motor protein MotB [Caldibacillus]MCB7070141.1 flagellar motor protein MotB [Caldibacillus sp. 210928-DFI.2.22]MCB7073605.1 flagellar motor protein MotB [Caldibacillus sp. 210928-DFI.2.18]MCM3798512.1 flagellar motor protein MotB [Caldibacillus thermoamylovorans]